MLGYIQEEGRVAYGNIWTLGSMLAMGLTPIAVGTAIEYGGVWGYRASFAAAAVGGLILAVAVRYGLHEDRPVRPSLTVLLNPVFPLRTLARIVWISAGLHESNRAPADKPAPRN
jgi:MFS family permease